MNHPMGVGVIGARPGRSWGAIAHIPAIAASPDFRLAAIATSSIATARESAAHFGAAHAYDDPLALASDPSVDVVAICVRVPEHARLVAAAIEAGKHVYCEWPLGRDTAEAEAMLAAAHKAGIVHMIGLQARVVPELLHLKALLAQGAIGRPISATLSLAGRWASEIQPGMEYLQKEDSGGNYFTIAGGHALDLYCHILGEFETIAAATAIQVPEVKVGQRTETRTSPDHFSIAGSLRDGVFGAFTVRGLPAGGSGIRFEINGEAGTLLVTAAGQNPMIQMSDLSLFKVAADGAPEKIEPSAACYLADRALPAHAYGVGQCYAALSMSICGTGHVPADFGDAVANHRRLDRIRTSAITPQR